MPHSNIGRHTVELRHEQAAGVSCGRECIVWRMTEDKPPILEEQVRRLVSRFGVVPTPMLRLRPGH